MTRSETLKKPAILCAIILALTGCASLDSIPYSPRQTPQSWLQIQPFLEVELGKLELILVQPSSTIFVYLLGILAMAVGLYFFKVQRGQLSRSWWGIALILWGLGALFAGTSYQAFSYEIKCAGKEICSWTSWWEVIYLILSAASIQALVISGAYSSCMGKCRKVLLVYAVLEFMLYVVLVTVGVLTLTKFLISFDLLLIVTAPNILFLFILNGRRYLKTRNRMDLLLAATWIWLGLVIGIYYIYLVLGLTEHFWVQGIWFSENDLLHLGLISWMAYIALAAAERIRDEPDPPRSTAGGG